MANGSLDLRRSKAGIYYNRWVADYIFVQMPIQGVATKWFESFKEFPIRQKPARFNLDRVVERLMPKQ